MNKSFKLGSQGENYIQQLMIIAEIECKKNDDHDLRYDYDLLCKVGRKKFTIEVKFDSMAEKTGNIALELWNTKKEEASGLTRTKANIWAVVIKDGDNLTAWLAKVSLLRSYIDNNTPLRVIEKAGDKNAYLVLYKDKEILADVFHRIDSLRESEVRKIVRSLL